MEDLGQHRARERGGVSRGCQIGSRQAPGRCTRVDGRLESAMPTCTFDMAMFCPQFLALPMAAFGIRSGSSRLLGHGGSIPKF